ncbi:MAG: hypothetical protein ACOYD6_05945 [Limnochordia bacterium]|jgi:Skp family chaperone for outer membrane proteins
MSSKKLMALGGLLLLIGLFLGWQQGSLTARVGIVDVTRLRRESGAALQVEEELTSLYREMMEELRAEKGPSSEEERIAKEIEVFQAYRERREALEAQLEAAIDEAIEKERRRRRLALVISGDLVYTGGIDITEGVLARLQGW